MSTRQQIIVNALRQRYVEVCKAASQPGLSDFSEWTAPKTWFASSGDSLSTIRALAADEPIDCIEAAAPEDPAFFDRLQASIRDPGRRFELLTTRYAHPLNIAAPSEEKVREHLLERLMVRDRSHIEQHSLNLLHADDLLFRLNLLGIFASLSTDLRYLDALNYFYELLPADWRPESPHSWLRTTFLSLYARALAVHSRE